MLPHPGWVLRIQYLQHRHAPGLLVLTGRQKWPGKITWERAGHADGLVFEGYRLDSEWEGQAACGIDPEGTPPPTPSPVPFIELFTQSFLLQSCWLPSSLHFSEAFPCLPRKELSPELHGPHLGQPFPMCAHPNKHKLTSVCSKHRDPQE